MVAQALSLPFGYHLAGLRFSREMVGTDLGALGCMGAIDQIEGPDAN
jgi:hypothetical protein